MGIHYRIKKYEALPKLYIYELEKLLKIKKARYSISHDGETEYLA
ncbi:hypothetical protein SAMN04515668_4231 [Hymenobacter arizonensis]|uniref:Uncharacterized protein n=1 Tax=Hymenobacter arizonensis TaxID=1227077 RepID=A0A1I6B6N3_HYMAR|nr:hypothetical protein SAMN04515668_4231 [Hymenobacter arizonensis]